MKKIYSLFTILCIAAMSHAQAPNKFNYQGIARNSTGAPLASQPLGLKISILDGSATGTVVYSETQSTTTNSYGLYNVAIGSGTAVTGTMAGVNWSNGDKYVKIEIDPTGGTSYVALGTSQLLSVPYALYAGGSPSSSPSLSISGNVLTVGSNSVTLPTGTTYTPGTGINIAGNTISVDNLNGDITGAPNANLVAKIQGTTVASTTPTSGQVIKYNGTAYAPAADNDGQTLSLTGATLAISGGNSVLLPTGTTYTAGTGVNITANAINVSNLLGDVTGAPNATTVARIQGTSVAATAPSSGQILKYNGTNYTPGADNDGQTLTLTGNSLAISNGNAVSLPVAPTYTAGTGITVSGTVISANNLAGDVTGAPNANTVTKIQGTNVAATTPTSGQVIKYNGTSYTPAADNDGQVLTFSGQTLSISGGNSVTLPAPGGANLNGTANYVTKFTGPTSGGNSTIYDDGTSVGIGTTTPGSTNRLMVFNPNTTASSNAIRAVVGSAANSSFTPPSAIYGESSIYYGISGVSSGQNGVWGNSAGAGFAGVAGVNSATGGYGVAGSASGAGIGGYFDGGPTGVGLAVATGGTGIGTLTPNGRLVVAQSTITGIDTAAAIYAYSNSLPGSGKGGVYGTYNSINYYGVGIQGSGLNGVNASGFGSNFVATTGQHLGVYGSASTYGILGTSLTGTGVMGYSKSTTESGTGGVGQVTGVFGNSVNMAGTSAPNSRYGVQGTSSGGTNFNYGVYGAITTNTSGTINVGTYGGASGIGGGVNYGVLGTASGGVSNFAGYFTGNVNVTGTIAKAGGTFKIDHPLDPENKYLYHSFVESPDMMNIYNGNITTDGSGFATVELPDYFDALNKDFRYQLTVIGTFAQAIVQKEISGNTFVIQTNQPNVKVSWQVTGVRQDKYANAHRVVPEVNKEEVNKGRYIHPAEWGQPAEKGIDYKLMQQAPMPVNEPAK